ncbi:hypothetical protein J1614_010809 [Plenodomus biglobosus]|nr:hypothetical protein J1614_010809 [Plenodomus biglobosus]
MVAHVSPSIAGHVMVQSRRERRRASQTDEPSASAATRIAGNEEIDICEVRVGTVVQGEASADHPMIYTVAVRTPMSIEIVFNRASPELTIAPLQDCIVFKAGDKTAGLTAERSIYSGRESRSYACA